MFTLVTKRQHRKGFEPIGEVLREIACRLVAQRNRKAAAPEDAAAVCPATTGKPGDAAGEKRSGVVDIEIATAEAPAGRAAGPERDEAPHSGPAVPPTGIHAEAP